MTLGPPPNAPIAPKDSYFKHITVHSHGKIEHYMDRWTHRRLLCRWFLRSHHTPCARHGGDSAGLSYVSM